MAATTIAATKVPHTTTQGHLIRLREKQPGVTWVATARGTYGTPEAGTRTAYAPCEPPPRASCPVPPVHTARRCVQVRRPVRTSTEEALGRTCQPTGVTCSVPSSSTFERRELGRLELWPAAQRGVGVLPSKGAGWRAAGAIRGAAVRASQLGIRAVDVAVGVCRGGCVVAQSKPAAPFQKANGVG